MSDTPVTIILGWTSIAVAIGWAQGPTALAAFGVFLFAVYLVTAVWEDR